MPYHLHSPVMDSGLNSPSMAGMGSMINPPLRGPEHNNHRRRELTGTHQDGGTEHVLRRGLGQAADGPAGTGQANGTGNLSGNWTCCIYVFL